MTRLRQVSLFAGLVAMGALAGCASPNAASPNAQASAPAAAPAPAPQPTTTGEEAAAVGHDQITVTFPSGGTTLTPDANHQLDLAARLFRDANPVVMFTTGYSDSVGDEYHNLLLSAQRAESVKRGLVARGIPAQRLLIQALGESELANRDDPGAMANRRVVVTWRLL